MKKKYTEPEFDVTRFLFKDIMYDQTLHSVRETGDGYGDTYNDGEESEDLPG